MTYCKAISTNIQLQHATHPILFEKFVKKCPISFLWNLELILVKNVNKFLYIYIYIMILMKFH